MASISTLPFLLTLLFSSSLAFPSLILQACSRIAPTLQPLCISSLSAEPPSAHADLRLLAIISVRIAAGNASQTAAFLSGRQIEAASDDPMLYQCAADCADLYVDAVEQLDTTTAAVDDAADGDAAMWLEAAMADVVSCERGCGAAATPEIRRRNDGAKKLLSIAISLAEVLRKGL